MADFSEQCLYDLLLDRFDYKSEDIKATIKELMKLSDKGKKILEEYIETGSLPLAKKNGLSLHMMRKQAPHEMTDIALILVFDGLQQHIDNVNDVISPTSM